MNSRTLKYSVMFAMSVLGTIGCASDDIGLGEDNAGVRDGAEGPPTNVVEGYGVCSPHLNDSCTDVSWTNDPSVPTMVASSNGDASDCYCLRECTEDSECPAPDTGTAQPACGAMGSGGPSHWNVCLLPCPNGEICPDGMTCSDSLMTTDPICVWHTDADENIDWNPEVCGERTTREACEAVLSDFPVELDRHCAWATEHLIGRDSDQATVTERCVAVEVSSPTDTSAPSCPGTELPVYWADAGAGDVSLLVLESLDYSPRTSRGTWYSACEIESAEISSPDVCHRACDGD